MDPITFALLLGGWWLLTRKPAIQSMPPIPANVENTPTIQYSQPVPSPAGASIDVLDQMGVARDTAVWLSSPIPWVNPSWTKDNSPVVQTGFIPGRTGIISPSAVALGGLGCGCRP